MSVLGLIFGIVSILLSLTFFTIIGPIFGIVAGGIGVIVSIMARRKAPDVLGAVALTASLIGVILNVLLSLTCLTFISGARFVGNKVINEMQKSDMNVNKIQDKFKNPLDDGYRKQFEDAFKQTKKNIDKKPDQNKNNTGVR